MTKKEEGATTMGNADQVRTTNRELDAALEALALSLDPARLTELEAKPEGEEAWSAAIVLAHLGEFPAFFASELRRFMDDRGAPVGRTHSDPGRLAAIDAAEGKSRDELVAGMRDAMASLADALELLQDDDLAATTNNRRYGNEPLTAFVDRYVLGHKRGHLDQLAAMPAAADRRPRQPQP